MAASDTDCLPLTSLDIYHLKPAYLSHLTPDFTFTYNGAKYVSQDYLHSISPFICLQKD
jgi:hypothetical protein